MGGLLGAARFAARAETAKDLLVLRFRAAVITSGLLALAPAAAADPAGFVCTFQQGTAHAYEKGQFAAEKVAPLSFGISAVNGAAQTAELRTERGTAALRLVQAVNATHFLEVVTEGYLNITTIYDKDEASGKYPAVHSRHLAILGQPVVTQYQGFCEGKD
jgi:hypothetical protein